METLLTFFILAFVILLGVNFWLFKKFSELKQKIEDVYKGTKNETKVADADMKYMKGLELDFAALEEKVGEAEQTRTEFTDLFNKITEEVDRQKTAIEELEEKVEELERLRDKIEEKEEEDEDEEK